MSSAPDPGQERAHRAVRRVTANTLALSVADVANKLMMFAFYVIAARHLGVSDYGALSLALAVVTMFAVLTDLGLGAVAARDIARNPDSVSYHVGNALTIKFVASIVVVAAVLSFVRLLGYPARTVYLATVCSVFVVETAFTSYAASVFQGFEKMHYTALTRLVQGSVLVVGATLLSRGPVRVGAYAWLYVLAGLVSAMLSGSVLWFAFVRPRLSLRFDQWGVLLRQALPLAIAVALVTFYYWIGSTILSRVHGDAATGAYSAAFRLVWGASFAGFAFSGAVYPLMARLHARAPGRLAKMLGLAVRYIVLLGLPIGVMGSLFAGPLVKLVYGPGFDRAASTFRILAWWGGLACLSSLLSNYLIATDRARMVTVQAAVSLAVCLAANLVLIPPWGAAGAASALLLAEATGTAFLFVAHRLDAARVQWGRMLDHLVKAGAAVLASAGCAWLLMRWFGGWAPVAALPVYFVGLVATRGLAQDDLALARMILRKSDG